jgi:hypothetical protein
MKTLANAGKKKKKSVFYYVDNDLSVALLLTGDQNSAFQIKGNIFIFRSHASTFSQLFTANHQHILKFGNHSHCSKAHLNSANIELKLIYAEINFG